MMASAPRNVSDRSEMPPMAGLAYGWFAWEASTFSSPIHDFAFSHVRITTTSFVFARIPAWCQELA